MLSVTLFIIKIDSIARRLISKANFYLCNAMSSKVASRSLKEWHCLMGHCNVKDVLHLENVVDGVKFLAKIILIVMFVKQAK